MKAQTLPSAVIEPSFPGRKRHFHLPAGCRCPLQSAGRFIYLLPAKFSPTMSTTIGQEEGRGLRPVDGHKNKDQGKKEHRNPPATTNASKHSHPGSNLHPAIILIQIEKILQNKPLKTLVSGFFLHCLFPPDGLHFPKWLPQPGFSRHFPTLFQQNGYPRKDPSFSNGEKRSGPLLLEPHPV